MLVLFDIDGTMLSSEGVGVRSIEEAGESLFGKPFSLDGIPIGGRLDPLIWNDACAKHGIDQPDEYHDNFRSIYFDVLAKNMRNATVTTLPGVKDLVEACCAIDEVTLGIVTGNYEETGRLKLEAAGFDMKNFVANAWGTDGYERKDLPPVAMKQCLHAMRSVLIGDTVHDITSGQSSGCKVIAVCTGSHDRATLSEANPDLLLEDLSDTEVVLEWIFHNHNQ